MCSQVLALSRDMGEVVPGFPEVAGESCTTEDVQGQEITFRNLVPVAGSSRAVL